MRDDARRISDSQHGCLHNFMARKRALFQAGGEGGPSPEELAAAPESVKAAFELAKQAAAKKPETTPAEATPAQ
jgi:hypothetical protein